MKKKTAFIIIVILISLLLICAIINAIVICNYSKKDEKKKCDVAIVLGAETDDNGVSPVYAERINHGIWLYNNHYVDYLILTGGKGENSDVSDAYRAKEYALSKGVPENVIFLEDNSTITQENLEFSKNIMSNNKWDSCIIVSDPLHMKRAMLMAKDYKMNALSSPTQTGRFITWKTKFSFLMREVMFYTVYKIYRIFI